MPRLDRLHRALDKAYHGQFMQPQIWDGVYYEIDTTEGTWFIEESLCGENPEFGDFSDYIEAIITEDDINSVECKKGFLCRLSANGYLDCTETVGFRTQTECINYLLDLTE